MPRRSPTTDPDDRGSSPTDSPSDDEPWSPDDVGPVEGLEEVDGSGGSVLGAGLPSVVAVMVTRDPGPALEEALTGLVEQDYGNLSILVVDAGSRDDPTARIAEVAPRAFVKRSRRSEGFGAAANAVQGAVEGATFLLFVHDDVELAPGAVHAMVTEAFRANAGIVGAKLVDWNDPQRLRSVGLGSDRFGFGVPVAEPGELDQSQHDAPREVMGVQHAAMLVRSDLFADLGGFAPELIGPGDALDLCWRARVAGARTVVMPAAVARHRETSGIGDGGERPRQALRNTARMVLANYSLLHLVRVLPQAVFASVLDALVSLLSGRFHAAADVVAAWGWNLARLASLPKARRRTASARRVGDAEVRAEQLRGSARFNAWVRSARDNGERHDPTAEPAGREAPWGDAGSLAGVLIGLLAVVVTVFGARHLISGGVPAIRDLAPFRDAGSMMAEWWNGWRTTGTGAAVSAPPSLPAAALLVAATLGHPGFARTLVVLASIPVGAIGAWRLLAGDARVRSRAAVALAYLVVPVVYDGLAEGRAAVLGLYAVLPWVVGRLLRAGELLPSSGASTRWASAARLGLLVALGAIVAPELLPISVFLALALAVVQAASGRGAAARRVLTVGLGGVGLAALVHLPQLVGVVTGSQRWSLLTRTGASSRELPTLWDAIHLGGSSERGAFLAVGLVIAAALPLLVAQEWRLRLSAFTWLMLLGGWAVLVLSRREILVGVGSEEALVCSALGAAIGVGLGLEAFGVDVRGGAFGFRQLASVVAAIAAVAAALPMALAVWGGRFDAPDNDAVETLQTLGGGSAPQFRTLWIGDRDTLPLGGWTVSGSVVAATTEGIHPDLSTAAPPTEGPGERAVLGALRLASAGETTRLGRLIAPAAIRYVVVVGDGNVTGTSTRSRPSGPLADALAAQLDLYPLAIAPGLAVYENRLVLPMRATVADDAPLEAAERGGPRQVLDAGDIQSTQALRRGSRTSRVRGEAGPGTLAVAMTRASGWSWSGTGKAQRSFGWAQRYEVGSTVEQGSLSYRPTGAHLSLLGVQLVIVLGVAVVALPKRRGRGAPPEEDAP